ncbi:Pol polyprotein [Triplophysa rosa]|uniref:Gypsy retrotransposon integrase-like protein 1 n=1 Tax=Triplophysa rosa TaxID=992332 RepID=A0A9W7WXY0_TRIRA|nr:Pol polyprotein [Triplophysa rosa]
MARSVVWSRVRLLDAETANAILDRVSEFLDILETLPQLQVPQAYSVPLVRGLPGRPQYSITQEQLRFLLEYNFSTKQMAEILGVSKRTVKRRLRKFNISLRDRYTNLSDSDLDNLVRELVGGNDELGAEAVRARLAAVTERSHQKMDSAGTDPLRVAVTQQGVLLGQQVNRINTTAQDVQVLNTQVSELAACLQAMQVETAAQTARLQLGSVCDPEPHVNSPPVYHGDPNSCRAFLSQCTLVFNLQPRRYTSEAAKVSFVLTLLAGMAREWGMSVWDAQSSCCASFEEFRKEMERLFDRSVSGDEAATRLSRLKQGRASITEYSIQFQTLSAACKWNAPALRARFLEGLSDAISEELAVMDVPEDLEGLISLALRVEAGNLASVPAEYHDLGAVFSKSRAISLPPHHPYDCAIDLLPGTSPPRGHLFSLTGPESEAMDQYIRDSLQSGLIRHSSSTPGAGFFFGARVFTKLYLLNAYHLVRIREGDEWKTAFNTPTGHYEYLVLPFGLTNAPAVFQGLVNSVLGDMINQFVFVYLDDILIFSPSLQVHTQHVRRVLQRLLENRLFVKAEKCEFHAESVTFLGHIISTTGIQADPAKIEAAAKWPIPDSRREVQRFLGFANFYLRFIRNFGQIAAPLTALNSSKVSFRWNQNAQVAFDTLKSRFVSAPVLSVPDPDRQFIVEVDASGVGVGAILSQRSAHDGKVHPCAYFSHRLCPAERNYDIGNRELLVVKLALGEWRHWLEGAAQPFLFWTDHKNLEYVRSARRLSSRQARWALFFGRFNFTLSFLPVSKNTKPDALSRLFESPDERLSADAILPTGMVVGAISWGVERRVKEASRGVQVPTGCPAGRLFVPEALRPEVLQWGHSSRLVCHPGIRRTKASIRQRFWWPSWITDVRQFVLACPTNSPTSDPAYHVTLGTPSPPLRLTLPYTGVSLWNHHKLRTARYMSPHQIFIRGCFLQLHRNQTGIQGILGVDEEPVEEMDTPPAAEVVVPPGSHTVFHWPEAVEIPANQLNLQDRHIEQLVQLVI